MAMSKQRSRWRQNLAVLTVTSLLCFGATEVALRLVAPVQTFVNPLRAFHRHDPDLGWTGTPNLKARFRHVDFDVLVRSDANGFRERQTTNAPGPGSPLCLVLGDSYTWGWGVENGEVFTDVMQNELGSLADVRNCGVNAYGTLQELLLLQRCLTNGLRPRLVIVMFCFNDFYDNINPAAVRPSLAVDGERVTLRNHPVAERIEGPFGKLVKQSHLFSAIDYMLAFTKEKRRTTELQRQAFPNRTVAAGPRAAMAYTLAGFKQTCDRAGAGLWFVRVPAFNEFLPGADAETGDTLKALCDQAGVQLLELAPEFRATGNRPTDFYFPHDAHWTAKGHQLVGRTLAGRFRQELEQTAR
jgi:lysophospholipase L1-like esterase